MTPAEIVDDVSIPESIPTEETNELIIGHNDTRTRETIKFTKLTREITDLIFIHINNMRDELFSNYFIFGKYKDFNFEVKNHKLFNLINKTDDFRIPMTRLFDDELDEIYGSRIPPLYFVGFTDSYQRTKYLYCVVLSLADMTKYNETITYDTIAPYITNGSGRTLTHFTFSDIKIKKY